MNLKLGKKRLIADINELKISRIVSCIIKYFINTTIDHSKEKIADYLENKNEISGESCPEESHMQQ